MRLPWFFLTFHCRSENRVFGYVPSMVHYLGRFIWGTLLYLIIFIFILFYNILKEDTLLEGGVYKFKCIRLYMLTPASSFNSFQLPYPSLSTLIACFHSLSLKSFQLSYPSPPRKMLIACFRSLPCCQCLGSGVGQNLQDHLQIRPCWRVENVPTLNEQVSVQWSRFVPLS